MIGLSPVAGLRCSCGSAEMVCFDPGQAPEIDMLTDTLLSRGRTVTGTCMACWRPAGTSIPASWSDLLRQQQL